MATLLELFSDKRFHKKFFVVDDQDNLMVEVHPLTDPESVPLRPESESTNHRLADSYSWSIEHAEKGFIHHHFRQDCVKEKFKDREYYVVSGETIAWRLQDDSK
jgi:hypothetical protein